MHRLFLWIDRNALRPFDFAGNFFYYWGQPQYGMCAAWQMAWRTLPE